MLNEATRDELALRRKSRRGGLVEEARGVFRQQARAIAQLGSRIGDDYAKVVELLYSNEGHVVVIGVGKSGLIGKKIAATFASTGTPSFFVHSAEALHGDLGMVTERDTALIISYSGETEETVRLIPHLKRLSIPMIGFVGALSSTLGKGVDIALDLSVDEEACPNNLAPTNSTLAAMAMGDALAVSLMQMRRFQAADFARFHPGGSLGRRLLMRVQDAMRQSDLPIVSPCDTVGESLMTITQGRLGLGLVMSGDRLVGLVTDGDLRRAMQRHDNLLSMSVSEIMTLNPVTIHENTLLQDAHQRMSAMKLKAFVVVNDQGIVQGVVEVFDEK